MTSSDTSCRNGAEEAHVTPSYDSNPHDLLFGMDCPMLGSDPDNCPISTSASPTDPNSLNALFQSIVHTSNNIFHPQPMVASSYQQLLHLPNEAPLQPPCEQTTTDRYATAHASPQSPSSIFENEAFQAVHLPFEFLPLGAATSSLTESTNIQLMANSSGFYHLPLQSYYQSLSSQNMPQGQADCRPSPATSSAQESLQSISSAVSALRSGQPSQGRDIESQRHLQSEQLDHKLPEEPQPAGDLDVAFSSCALADASSFAERTPVKSLDPAHSNKISSPANSASDDPCQRKFSTIPESNPVVCRLSSKNLHRPSKLAISNSFDHNSPKVKSKNLKRNRPEKSSTHQNLISRPDQLITPSRPNILANKKINPNILPPTPDSLQRPKNLCSTSRDNLCEESGQKKKQKIESIEKALKALDTLTDYLSQEANECTSHNEDLAEYQNQISPHQHPFNPSLSLVSPQHFFTLGELGGRLRRRLDVHRR